MLPIKNTKEERLIKLIQQGFFKRKRKPNVILIYNLSQALKKLNNHKLAKELAYCITSTSSYRLMHEDRYKLAFNAVVLKNWDNVAVVQLENKSLKFCNFVCVTLEEYTEDFKRQNPVFIKMVLTELNIIRRS